MNSSEDRSHRQCARFAFAVVTGVVSGAVRAIIAWLLDQATPTS